MAPNKELSETRAPLPVPTVPIGFADTTAFAAEYSAAIVVTPTKLVAFQP